jgi:phospholipase C
MITGVSASVRIALRLGTAVASGGLAVSAALGAAPADVATATPIKHVVVVFQENVPFDRYFGAYPYALNPPGEPRFVARPGTPSVNGLTDSLRNHNPNSANPHRLARDTPNGTAANPNGCGSNHGYTPMQLAEDGRVPAGRGR